MMKRDSGTLGRTVLIALAACFCSLVFAACGNDEPVVVLATPAPTATPTPAP